MATRRVYLQLALAVFGAVMLLVYPLMRLWPAGWAWTPGHHDYEQMIVNLSSSRA